MADLATPAGRRGARLERVRGQRLDRDPADDDENLIAHQVFSGLAVRMALLYRTIVGYSDGVAQGEVL